MSPYIDTGGAPAERSYETARRQEDHLTVAAESEALRVENSTDLLILLLYAPGSTGVIGEPIEGITRLQKLMFLLERDEGPKELVKLAQERFGFDPYKLGPYSKGVAEAVDELRAAGIIRSDRLDYWITDDSDNPGELAIRRNWGRAHERHPSARRVESYRFSLNPAVGTRVGERLWSTLSAEDRKRLSEFKAFFNALSLRQLLIFVYDRYPKYTTESTIKHQLEVE